MNKNNEQLIIDGVEVSGCEFYWREEELCNNGNLTSDCQENKDCIYKRLKRTEQEYEKANKNAQDTYELYQAQMESFNILQGEKIKLETQLNKLKEENEELKEKINNLVCSTNCYKYQEAKELKAENKKLKNEIKDLEDLAKFKTEAIRNLQHKLNEVIDD